MQLAVVAPTNHISRLCAGPLGTIQLCLSHLVNGNEVYSGQYAELSINCGHRVILDNSAHEMYTGADGSKLYEAARRVAAFEICLPDRLFFGDDTYENSERALEYLQSRLPGQTRYMAVPQGRTPREWSYCLRRLCTLPIHTIGISKDYEVWDGGLVKLVKEVPSQFDVHLLGWSRGINLPVWVNTELKGRVRSIDSAKPVVYAARGMLVSQNFAYPRRPSDYFDMNLGCNVDYAIRNINYLRGLIGDKNEL